MTNKTDYTKREEFRRALLSKRSEEEWNSTMLNPIRIYSEAFKIGDTELTGKEVVERYREIFPSSEDKSLGTTTRRMFYETRVPHLSFANPEVLRMYLLSASSAQEWEQTEISPKDFSKMRFQYAGHQIKGQMLLLNAYTDISNQEKGTHFTFSDHLKAPASKRIVHKAITKEFLKEIFERAEVKARYDDISEHKLTLLEAKKIILDKMSEESWRRYEMGISGFESIRFDYDSFRSFTGETLRRALDNNITSTQFFERLGIEIGADSMAPERRVQENNEQYARIFTDSESLRKIFLQIQTEDQWKKPQLFSNLRGKEILVSDKSIVLHSFLQLYGLHRYNQETGENYSFTEIQDNEELKEKLKSNTATLCHLLSQAGIEYGIFNPKITDLNLSDPNVIRRMLSNGKIHHKSISLEELAKSKITDFRKTVFRDPETEVEISGQSLMMYHTAQRYAMGNPTVSTGEALIQNKGKSNTSVKNGLLELIGIETRKPTERRLEER